jgi:hypothetical protein
VPRNVEDSVKKYMRNDFSRRGPVTGFDADLDRDDRTRRTRLGLLAIKAKGLSR